MNNITLNAAVRTVQGSKAAGRLRRAGKIPAILKRASGESTLIELDAHAFDMTMRGTTIVKATVTLDIGGTQISAIIHEIQNDVMTGAVSHIDFGEVAL